MKSTLWIGVRAAVALALLVGFYVFACVIAILLLTVPYVEFVYGAQLVRFSLRFSLAIAVVCIGAALTILWSLVPRVDKFTPPGPGLTPSDHPRLFDVLQDLAGQVRQRMPNDVYLVGDVNAFVTHRGGFMGFGSRRVMGLGLPLLQLVTVSELKAIVAHEFGHYCAGDVRLGPWIYKTRAAIVRTLQGLSGTVFQGLFVGYARMFLRVSSAVSRHQEYLADRLAAETAGASRLISALTRVASGTRAFHIYLANDVMPVLGAGYAPPLVDGFARFLAEPHIAEALSKGTDTSQPTADPNDTHPRLADRIKAVEALLASEDVDHSGPAIDLLDNAMSLDQALLTYNPDGPPRSLVPVSWSSVAMQVFLPQWLRALEQIAPHLGEVRVEKLPTSVSGAIPLARGLKNPAEGYVSGDELARRLVWAVGAAVCVTLARRGWTFDLAPGRGFRVSDGSLECAPFVEAEGIVFGRTRSERWIEFCAKTGLSGSPRDLAGSLSVSAAFRLEKN